MINNLKEVTRLLLYKTAYFFDYPIIPPDTLQFSLTSRCNLFCKMCSVHKYLTKQEEEMPFGEISKIITTAKKQFGIKNLVLTGGEPLLLPELVAQIAAFACKLGIRIILTTNGFYLEKYAQLLAHSGVAHFHISIDGLENTHNNIRRNNASFDKAVRGIKILTDLRKTDNLRYSIGIGTVILKSNIPELYELFVKADSLGVDVMDILPYLPDNTDFSSIENTFLWPDKDAVDLLLRTHKKISETKTNHIKMNDFINTDLISKYYTRTMRKNDWQCMAGLKNLFVTMSDPKKQGKFEPCIFMCKAHIPVRDYNYDLKKIWFSAQAQSARRDIKRCDVYCYQPCFSLPPLLKILKLG